MIHEQAGALAPLRRQWLLVAACYGTVLAACHNALRLLWNPQQSLQWLLAAGTLMALQLVILWWALPYNRPQAGDAETGDLRLRPVLGYANALTLLRGLLACLLAGFLLAPTPQGWWAWAPALLYTFERLLDFADGYVARITRSESKLGEILDIEFDGLGLMIAVILGIQADKLPPWYLVLGLARPLFVLGLWLRSRWGWQNFDLPPSEHRRVIAGFQTGFVSLVLWPLWPPAVTLLAAYVMAVPLVFSFGRDWLVVSGVIDAGGAAYLRARGRAKALVEGWLPLLARLGAVALGLPLLWGSVSTLPEGPGAGGVAALALGLPALLAVGLGVAGRIGALVLAALATLSFSAAARWEGAALLVCALIVAHLGSGNWALWTPEERLLRTKAGARLHE